MHPKVANSMTAGVIGFKKALVGTARAISFLLCMIGLSKQSSYLVQPPFLALKVFHHQWLAESVGY